MPSPTSATTLQRPDLGQVAYEYQESAPFRGLIAQKILPLVSVRDISADYPVLPTEATMKLPNARRAQKGAYTRLGWEFATGTYSCEEFGLETPVDDVEAKLYMSYFDAEAESLKITMDTMLRNQEARAAALLFNTSNAVANAAVSTEWSTASTCTPKADIKAAITAMRAASGVSPNAIVMSLKVFENVLNAAELKTYLQYTAPHLVDGMEAQRLTLARYFGVEEVLVGGAISDSSKKGQSTVISDIWDDEYISLCRIAKAGEGFKTPSFGRSFLWTPDSAANLVVETYREEQIRANIIRVRHHIDEAIVSVGSNYLLTNITA